MSRRALREDLVTQACLEAYAAVRDEGRLADRSLDFVLRRAKHLYSQERRAVAERVYALLRRQRLVDFLAERAAPGFTTSGGARQHLARFAVSRVLEGEAPGEVARQLGFGAAGEAWLSGLPAHREALRTLEPTARYALEASVPDFLAARLLAELGETEAQALAEALARRAPLTVRVNALRTTREALASQLAEAGVTTTPTPLSPLGLFLETRVNVFSLEAFKAGLFEVQDEGSQLLGMLVDAPPRTVVDACAGAGGKTLQLAAQMKNRGTLHALDVDARRLEELRQRARRADVHNVRVQAIAPGPEAEAQLATLVGTAERVLVDAPCSGTGTYRRKPDGRYRLTEQGLHEHTARQRTLIARFAALVKPGGRLVYGTCSLLREENEAVVEQFLEAHPDFQLAPAGEWLGEALSESTTRDGMLRLYPHRHGTDGFFGAVLRRSKEPTKRG